MLVAMLTLVAFFAVLLGGIFFLMNMVERDIRRQEGKKK